MKTKIFKAFTLIELLIVIVIIGILATALIPRVTGVQNKARKTAAIKAINDLRTAIFIAQSNSNKTLMDITNHGCTACECNSVIASGANLNTIPNNDNCRQGRLRALRKIEAAAGYDSGYLSYLNQDPWGAPYLLDENEDPNSSNRCLYPDQISVVGPDGRVDGSISGTVNDGILEKFAPMGCPTSY